MLSSSLAAEDSELTREQTIELTIIIPAFNEAGTIIPNLQELIAWLAKSMAEIRAEILVIDDGSRDGMAEKIKQHELCRNGMIRVVSHGVHSKMRGLRAIPRSGSMTAPASAMVPRWRYNRGISRSKVRSRSQLGR